MKGQQIGQAVSEQEEKMGTNRQVFRLKAIAWSTLLLAGLIGGCTPLIDIKVEIDNTVSTCPSGGRGGGGGQELPPGGTCTASTLSSSTDANLYNNAKNVSTGQPITDHIHMCNTGSGMCGSNPGSKYCPTYPTVKACKTLFTPDVPPNGLTGTCQCGCP